MAEPFLALGAAAVLAAYWGVQLGLAAATGPDPSRLPLAVAALLSAFGLLDRRPWGRWLGLAAGWAGLAALLTEALAPTEPAAWIALLPGPLLVGLLLVPGMRDYCEGGDPVFGQRLARVAVLRAATVAALAAALVPPGPWPVVLGPTLAVLALGAHRTAGLVLILASGLLQPALGLGGLELVAAGLAAVCAVSWWGPLGAAWRRGG
jgi:hypothetical protein